MKRKKFVIHPLFMIFALIFCIYGKAFYFMSFLSAVLIHEYAHYYEAKRNGVCLENFSLMPYGARIDLSSSILRSREDIRIALAGPLINIIASIITVSIWWIYPMSYIYTEYFVQANISLAIFNLLPLLPLDGSRIILAIAGRYKKRTIMYKILSILNVVASIMLFIGFIISIGKDINYTLGIMSFFVMYGAFEEREIYSYKNLISMQDKVLKKNKPMQIRAYAIREDSEAMCVHKIMNKDYYTMLIVMDKENTVKRIVMQKDFEKIFLRREGNDKYN